VEQAEKHTEPRYNPFQELQPRRRANANDRGFFFYLVKPATNDTVADTEHLQTHTANASKYAV